jgi:hypothetical protein
LAAVSCDATGGREGSETSYLWEREGSGGRQTLSRCYLALSRYDWAITLASLCPVISPVLFSAQHYHETARPQLCSAHTDGQGATIYPLQVQSIHPLSQHALWRSCAPTTRDGNFHCSMPKNEFFKCYHFDGYTKPYTRKLVTQ